MERLFVYGTLMSGCGNNRLLSGARLVQSAQVIGPWMMRDLGGIPAVTPSGRVGIIRGELWDNVSPAMLRMIDGLEGHPHWYERKPVVVFANDGAVLETDVWMYVMPRDQVRGPLIPGGDWRRHRLDLTTA